MLFTERQVTILNKLVEQGEVSMVDGFYSYIHENWLKAVADGQITTEVDVEPARTRMEELKQRSGVKAIEAQISTS